MRIFLTIIRVIVGVLFVFSGLIKANDPLGLSYKMQEFFEVWNLHSLNNLTLTFSVIMIAFEIIAGVAVILGWRMRMFSWLLLLLILFFTFLTAYALFSGKIKECGCFGDCIPLQAYQSFIKDLILLVLIGIIFYYRNKIQPSFTVSTSIIILFFTVVFSVTLQWYTLRHLPVIDCLPYKEGNNIPEKMRIPAGAVPDSTVISFVYDVSGKEVEFTADNFPDDFNDSTYKFVRRYDKVVRKGNAAPSIKDFSLQTFSGNDTTQALLNEDRNQLYLFFQNRVDEGTWLIYLDRIVAEASKQGIESFIVTNLSLEALQESPPAVFTRMMPLRTDATAIKTAARTNPTLMLVKKGTIIKKWSYASFDQALKYVQQQSLP